MEFSRPEYWSGNPISSPVDLPDPGIEPGSPALWADSLPTELSGKLYLVLNIHCLCFSQLFKVESGVLFGKVYDTVHNRDVILERPVCWEGRCRRRVLSMTNSS